MAHGLAPSVLASYRIDSILRRRSGRIDLRDVVILRVRWPLRQTCARCPRVAVPRVPRRRTGGPTLSPHRPTLADVAAAAHVSVSTASLAFSGAGPIAAATRQRVLDAAAALDYSGPNPLGRQLRRGRSGIVGVVVGDSLRRAFRDPVSIQVLDGLVSTLGPLDLGVLLIPGVERPERPRGGPAPRDRRHGRRRDHVGRHHRRPDARRPASARHPDRARRGPAAPRTWPPSASTTAAACAGPPSTCSRSATPGSRP